MAVSNQRNRTQHIAFQPHFALGDRTGKLRGRSSSSASLASALSDDPSVSQLSNVSSTKLSDPELILRLHDVGLSSSCHGDSSTVANLDEKTLGANLAQAVIWT